MNNIKEGGLEPIDKTEMCIDPQHSPQMHLHIPYGQQYRHVCPTCGETKVIRSSEVIF